MNKYLKMIVDWWNNQTPKIKKITIAVGASVIVLLILITVLIFRPNYRFFISGVTEHTAGELLGRLDQMNINYRVTAGGSIYVDEKNIDELRIRLASEGVLGGTTRGYDLLSDQGFGATSYDKQVNYQIALEGELSRSISTIRGVRHARVHLVIPPRTYYTTGQESKPTASVLVVMDTGHQLQNNQIRGIINFVSGAVQGLQPQDVKVVDNFSRDLSSVVLGDQDLGTAQSRLDMKKQVESYYSSKVQESLQSVFGFGNVVIISEINLDWQKLEQEIREVQPVGRDSGIIISRQEEFEESSTGPRPSDIPGADSNIPPFTYETPDGEGDFYRRSNVITNYDVSQIYTRTVQDRSGEIADKSFTVFLDFENANIPENETIINQITTAISTAVGAQSDSISVLSMQFNREIERLRVELEEEEARRRQLMIYIFTIMLAVIVITFVVFLIVLYLRKRRIKSLILERERKLEDKVREEVSKLGEEEVEEYTEAQEKQKKLEEIIDGRIEDVSEIIKIWINSQ